MFWLSHHISVCFFLNFRKYNIPKDAPRTWAKWPTSSFVLRITSNSSEAIKKIKNVFLNLIDHNSFCNFQLIIIDADATENTAPDAPIIGCELDRKYKPELKIPESIKYS